MKAVVVLSHVAYFRHFERVIRGLAARGSTVEVVVHREPEAFARSFRAWQKETGALFAPAIEPDGSTWQRLLWQIRDILNYAIYFHPNHPFPARGEHWRSRLPRFARSLAASRVTRGLLVSRLFQELIRRIARAIPVDPAIMQWLSDRRPDVVFASSCLMRRCVDMEYIRGAAALNIATVVAPASWDNLSTKGAFHVAPDIFLLWNDRLSAEAQRVHAVPGNKIVVTGAPPFDYWFDRSEPMDRQSLCEKVGLDHAHPFVVHVCSHKWETGDEVPFVVELAERIRSHPGLEKVGFVVRSHPSHAAIWEGFEHPAIRLWPQEAEVPDSPETRYDYLSVLHHASAVIGINTSAILDAACMDRPCVTIADERFAEARRGHFQYLHQAGFIETADDVAQAAAVIEAIVAGRDARAHQRREFVRTFIRGLHSPGLSASEATVVAIEQAAAGRTPAQVRSALRSNGRKPNHLDQ